MTNQLLRSFLKFIYNQKSIISNQNNLNFMEPSNIAVVGAERRGPPRARGEQKNHQQLEHFHQIMSHLQQFEGAQGGTTPTQGRSSGGSRARLKSPLEQQWDRAIELQAHLLESDYAKEMKKSAGGAPAGHQPKILKAKNAQRNGAQQPVPYREGESTLLMQGILRHRDVCAQQELKNQMRKQARPNDPPAQDSTQSDLDMSKTAESNEERAQFKMLMQSKQIMTHQITKRTAMKNYLQNNEKKGKKTNMDAGMRAKKGKEKSLLELAKETQTEGAGLPRQSLTQSEQDKIFKVNNIEIIKPAKLEDAPAERAEPEVEDEIGAGNGPSPNVPAGGAKAMPKENDPTNVKSPRSQKSQKSLRSGKSRGSKGSKRSRRSMKSQKSGGIAAKIDGYSNGSWQRKGLKEYVGEEGAQSAGLPAQKKELNARKQVNAVVLDFTKASGPSFKHNRRKSSELGIPGNDKHLHAKTLKGVQQQHDAALQPNFLLNQDFADNINAFFAADVKTASDVRVQRQQQQHYNQITPSIISSYQQQRVPQAMVLSHQNEYSERSSFSKTVKSQQPQTDLVRAAGNSRQRNEVTKNTRQLSGQIQQKKKAHGTNKTNQDHELGRRASRGGLQAQNQRQTSSSLDRQMKLKQGRISPKDSLMELHADDGSALATSRSRSGQGRIANQLGTRQGGATAQRPQNQQEFNQYLNEAPISYLGLYQDQEQSQKNQQSILSAEEAATGDHTKNMNSTNFNRFQRQFLAKQPSYQDGGATPQMNSFRQQRSRSTQNRMGTAGRSRSSSIQSLLGDQRLDQRGNHRLAYAPRNAYGSMAPHQQKNGSSSRGRSQSRRRVSQVRLNTNLNPATLKNPNALKQNTYWNSQAKNTGLPSQFTESTRSEAGPKNGSLVAYGASAAHLSGLQDLNPNLVQITKQNSAQASSGNVPNPHLSGLASFHQQQQRISLYQHQASTFAPYNATQKTMQDLGNNRLNKFAGREGPPRSSRQAHSVERGMQMKQQQALQTDEGELEEKLLRMPEGQYIMKQPQRDSARSNDNQRRNKFDGAAGTEGRRGRGGSQSKSRFNAIYNLKDNIMSGITGLGLFGQAQNNADGINISRAFKDPKELTEDDKKILEQLKPESRCKCERDPQYGFACKHGVAWFAANVVLSKIKRRLKQAQNTNDAKAQGHVIKQTILEEYQKCENHFNSLKGLDPAPESATQIERDLGRTFPMNEHFKAGNSGQQSLKNVLRAFACYDKQVDYVQGMNFIVGQLLMHCSETMAFWLFVELIEECELRDVFQTGLPGLFKHTYIIRYLIMKHLPDLHEHFERHQVRPELYASDLIFSVFTMVLPETETHVTAAFFNLFFTYKWEFFYKLILTVLDHIREQLLACDDMLSTFEQIKIAMSNKNDPYNHAHAAGARGGQAGPASRGKGLGVLVEMDSDLESVAGSVGKDRGDNDRPEDGAAPGKEDDARPAKEGEDGKKEAEGQTKSEGDGGKQPDADGEQNVKEEEGQKAGEKDKEPPKKGDDKKDQEVTPGEDAPKQGFFGGVKNIFFGFAQSKNATPGETPGQGPVEWTEFPWEKYLINEDIIKKWKQVDMKYIYHLHANFDIERAQFVNVELEDVSIIQTYSMVEGLVNQ